MAHYPFGTAEVEHDLGELTRGWDRTARLSRMQTRRRAREASEAQDLLDLVGWADDHRTDALESWAGAALLPGHEGHSEPIMMSGVPVDDFCLAELSAALGISQGAARARTEEALELRERLPRLWTAVHAGRLAAWMARQVARETRSLSDEAADFVDRQLAPFARTLTLTRIKRLVAAAIKRFDPERAAADERAAAEDRGVWFDLEHGGDELVTEDSRPNGTGRLEAVADVPDLLALKDALEVKAHEQQLLGDESSHQVRMAKGLGILADPQHALDLSAAAVDVLDPESGSAVATDSRVRRDRRPHRSRPVFGGDRPLHVHLHTSSQVARVEASGLPHAGSPISREAIERWIAELAPGVRVKVTPVVDLNRNHSVDAYEAPDHVRAMVELRDDTCVFPFCTNRGRFDLDHTTAYVPMDDGGPPGQAWTYKRVDSVFDLDPAGPDPWMPDWLREQSPGPRIRWASVRLPVDLAHRLQLPRHLDRHLPPRLMRARRGVGRAGGVPAVRLRAQGSGLRGGGWRARRRRGWSSRGRRGRSWCAGTPRRSRRPTWPAPGAR
ncbi:hypothetical protein J2S63_003037 [Marmoricola bigeumensis]|uniref:DUF222 domain-containing protein n=1 Tax=Nocardioides marmoribigeumensis TaxID=433649 RepID=A0ABU2BYK8_9ACTN|nr:hypothetical protein [Nocardioides marmoribigeumensis]